MLAASRLATLVTPFDRSRNPTVVGRLEGLLVSWMRIG